MTRLLAVVIGLALALARRPRLLVLLALAFGGYKLLQAGGGVASRLVSSARGLAEEISSAAQASSTFLARAAWGEGSAMAAGAPGKVTVLSWNTKHLGREGFDYEGASSLLRDADLAVLQEVGTTERGGRALVLLARAVEKRTGDKVCSALAEKTPGQRERFAFLWRNSRLSYVKTSGEEVSDCSSWRGSSITVPLVRGGEAALLARPPAVGLFKDKASGRRLSLAGVHLVPTAKHPEREVAPLFASLANVKGALVAAGDFNLPSLSAAFLSARGMGFLPALALSPKTSLRRSSRQLGEAYDNIWVRGAMVRRAGVINLLDFFPGSPERIYREASDHCPVFAQVEVE